MTADALAGAIKRRRDVDTSCNAPVRGLRKIMKG